MKVLLQTLKTNKGWRYSCTGSWHWQ